MYDVSEPTKQDITLPKKVTTQVNIKNNQTTKINKKVEILFNNFDKLDYFIKCMIPYFSDEDKKN